MSTGILIGTGECDMGPSVLRELGVDVAPRARIGSTRRHGRSRRAGYFEIDRNGVCVGFLRWDAHGRFFWHALQEH